MASYQDILESLSLGDMDKRDALTQGLLMAAAGALQGGPNTGSILGRSMYAGMEGYQGSMSAARKAKMDQLLARKAAFELSQNEQSIEDKKALAEAMRASAAAPQPGMASAPPQAATGAKDQRRMMLSNTIDKLVQSGRGDLAGPLQAELAKMEDEYSPEVRYDQSGRAFLTSKQGGTKYLEGIKARDKIVGDNLGDVERYRTEYDLNPLGTVSRGQTPDSKASNATTIRGQNMTDARAKEQIDRGRTVFDAERGMAVNLDTADARPITQGGAPLAPKVPEFAKKEISSIDQELASINGALEAVRKTPSAFTAARGAATMAGAGPESIAGRFDKPEEVQARSYVFNVVSKSINERAGAAQSAQELARLRSFLPAEMDSPGQIDAKLQGYMKYLSDRRSAVAGGGAPTAPEAPAGPPKAGTIEGGYIFMGGNPADPKSWKLAR